MPPRARTAAAPIVLAPHWPPLDRETADPTTPLHAGRFAAGEAPAGAHGHWVGGEGKYGSLPPPKRDRCHPTVRRRAAFSSVRPHRHTVLIDPQDFYRNTVSIHFFLAFIGIGVNGVTVCKSPTAPWSSVASPHWRTLHNALVHSVLHILKSYEHPATRVWKAKTMRPHRHTVHTEDSMFF